MTPDVDSRPLDPAVRRLWLVSNLLGVAVVGAIAAVPAILVSAAGGPPWIWALPGGAVALGAAAVAWWVPRAYRAWRIETTEDALVLRHGVVWQSHSTTPYFRIQHIDIAHGPLERAFGLASLTLRTASAATDATVPGVPADEAEALRRFVLERAGRGDAV